MCCNRPCLPVSFSGLTSQLRMLDVSDNSLTAKAIGQLTKTDWPCLECLYLRHSSTSVAASYYLVQGRWPILLELDISWVPLRASSLQVLQQRSNGVRHLGLTANFGNAAAFNLFNLLLNVRIHSSCGT